ncbi:hypothetical protein SLA2020_248790 [Shorea laevis]
MASSSQNPLQNFHDFLPLMAGKLAVTAWSESCAIGDFVGDGPLSQIEFCVLMFRLSPELMEASRFVFQEAIEQELKHGY